MQNDSTLSQRVRTMQIIALAIMGGLAMMLVLMVVLRLNQGEQPAAGDRLPIVSFLAVLMLVVNSGMALIVPNMQIQSTLRRLALESTSASSEENSESTLIALRQTTLIIRLAMLEGAGFLGCIAVLVEGQMWVVIVPVIALALMALQFPTVDGTRAWLEQQQARLNEARMR